jgi:hypothetical protein
MSACGFASARNERLAKRRHERLSRAERPLIRRVAVVILSTATFLLILADLALIALPRTTAPPDIYGLRGIGGVFGVVLTGLGGAIALRHPRNSVGWIYLGCGFLVALMEAAQEYASYALVEHGGTIPGGEWAVWLAQLALFLGLAPMATVLLLVFPNGHLPSARWRPVAWYTVCVLIALIATSSLVFTSVGYGFVVPNPVSLGFGISLDQSGRVLVSSIFLGPAGVLCAAAFVNRFRESRGVEHQQLKLVAYATVIFIAGLLLLMPLSFGRKPLEIAQQLVTLSVPVAAGIAVLRYRLYDIDVLINRTAVYGATSLAIAATFFIGIVALQALLRPITSGSELAIAASTLVSFALFQPIRRWVQDAVDRRFDRSRYDAARTLDLFADRLRDEVDLDALREDLLAAVRTTMAPAHVSLWLRDG